MSTEAITAASMPTETHIVRLGRYVAELRAEALPPAIVDRLRACLLYNLSVAFAGDDPAHPVQQAVRAVYAAPGQASVFVGGEKRSAADAAAINAALVTARGQNDTHPDISGHLGCIVIPAVLALAEERQASAADMLAALAAAYEVPPRIGVGSVAATTARGFRGTSLYAVFGATAGCARVLGLDAAQTANALSIAANFAGGLVQCYAEGTLEWYVQVANASRGGVIAALLAERGVPAARGALCGPRGFHHAYAGHVPTLDLAGWTLPQVTFKPYPGCAINQMPVFTLLQALAALRQEGTDATQVEAIDLALSPVHAGYPGIDRYGPFVSEASAIMSAPFMLQIALEQGSLRHADFQQRFGADLVHQRSQAVRVWADAQLAPFECRLRLQLRDGRVLDCVAPPASAMVLGWADTVALTRTLAQEWRTDAPDLAFDVLCDAVTAFASPDASPDARPEAPDTALLFRALTLPRAALH